MPCNMYYNFIYNYCKTLVTIYTTHFSTVDKYLYLAVTCIILLISLNVHLLQYAALCSK